MTLFSLLEQGYFFAALQIKFQKTTSSRLVSPLLAIVCDDAALRAHSTVSMLAFLSTLHASISRSYLHVGSPQMSICQTWRWPTLLTHSLSCVIAPFPHLSFCSSPPHMACLTSFPSHFPLSHRNFHNSWAISTILYLPLPDSCLLHLCHCYL